MPYFILMSQVKGKALMVDGFTGNRNLVNSAIRSLWALFCEQNNPIHQFPQR